MFAPDLIEIVFVEVEVFQDLFNERFVHVLPVYVSVYIYVIAKKRGFHPLWSVAFKLVADLRFAVSLDHGVAIRKPADRGGVITQVARRVAVDAAVRIESRILLDTLAARSGCHLANMVAVDVHARCVFTNGGAFSERGRWNQKQ